MSRTNIEWATHTWNPVTGCTKVSEGCRNCYAERMVQRLGSRVHAREVLPNGDGTWRDGEDLPFGRVAWHHNRLDQPLHWRKPRRVFVCSMSDLFHPDVPDTFIRAVFTTMAVSRRHTFLVLTKRPERMLALKRHWAEVGLTIREGFGAVLPNVWLGVSVENQATADERIPHLLQTPAAVRFVSCEPMLGPIALWHRMYGGHLLNMAPVVNGPGLQWVICGGESGPGARPMHPDWARSLRDQCAAAGVPFFFKQWGEWAPALVRQEEGWLGGACFDIPGGGTAAAPRAGINGRRYRRLDRQVVAVRVGKKAAGRELDGRTHDEFPEVTK